MAKRLGLSRHGGTTRLHHIADSGESWDREIVGRHPSLASVVKLTTDEELLLDRIKRIPTIPGKLADLIRQLLGLEDLHDTQNVERLFSGVKKTGSKASKR